MWRALGTTAYSSILKPGGSFTHFRLSRIASALRPVCGTFRIFGSELATLNCFGLPTSGVPCAAAGPSSSAPTTITIPTA
jgi:hypothetical protein